MRPQKLLETKKLCYKGDRSFYRSMVISAPPWQVVRPNSAMAALMVFRGVFRVGLQRVPLCCILCG